MKRLLTMAAMAIFVGVAAMAQIGESSSKKIETTYTTTTTTVEVKKSPSKGYSGMLEFNVGGGSAFAVGLTNVHGYQINPYIFAGAGFGVNFNITNSYDSVCLPLFADVRATVPFGTSPVAFFGDVRVGYTVISSYSSDVYFSPTIGIRVGRNKAATFGLGYEHVDKEDLFTFRIGFEW